MTYSATVNVIRERLAPMLYGMCINRTWNLFLQISIDDHSLNMIATDGAPFEKTEVESYIIYPGERFDFVVNASMAVKNYWIRFRGLADCGEKHTKQVGY